MKLYKTTKTGAIQTWYVTVLDDTFTTHYGQLDGAMQSQTTTALPKNIGKSNETTGAQQAQLEADALIAKKKKAGYSENIAAPTTVQLPMKVKIYQDQIKNIVFPCVSTPKLNGVNGTYRLVENTLILTSRGGEEYPAIPHLEPDVRAMMASLNTAELNGELYIPDTYLEDITSAVKKSKESSKTLQFAIFDIPLVNATYEERRNLLLQQKETTNIKLLTGIICNTHTDIEQHYDACMLLKLEGTVVKNLDGLYLHNVRSSDQFKYKKARDAEFLIVAYETDKEGHPTLVCKINNTTFKVRPKGTVADRVDILSNFNTMYLNKWYTVEYETMSKLGIPLKPVGIGLRECDVDGNPKE